MNLFPRRHKTELPTLQFRFFRALVLTGILTTFATMMGIGVIDVYTVRRNAVDNLSYYSEAMARVSAYNIDNSHELNHHLRDFSGLPGLQKSCIYDAEGYLLADWFRHTNAKCPSLISQADEIEGGFFSMEIARKIMSSNNEYLGIIYLESQLSDLTSILTRTAIMAFILILLTIALCMYISHGIADRISQCLRDLEEHIKYLQSDTKQATSISDPDATEETARLYRAVIRLRGQLVATLTPHEEVRARICWQESRLSGLLTLLRSRLPENSPLLPCIADHALILQLSSGHVTEDITFDIHEVADRALFTAKKIQPHGSELQLILSLKSDTPRKWHGAPFMIESLLRHLLLISLKNTRCGYARLHVEYGGISSAGEKCVQFKLEDTGSEIHPLQIERWLKEAREARCTVLESLDISWVVVAQVVYSLKGHITVTSATGKGLCLQGWVHLAPAEEVEASRKLYPANLCEITRPLILIVEDDRVNRHAQELLFKRLGCDVFAVADGASALEWAPLLPFSLILLDQMLPDTAGTVVARKLYEKMQDGLMHEIPIVALSAADTPLLREEWANMPVTRLLSKPLHKEEALQLRREINTTAPSFFDYADQEILQNLPAKIKLRWPEMRGQMLEQLLLFCNQLEQEAFPLSDILHSAHAVKSAALTLGFARLAACMESIEHHTKADGVLFFEENLGVVLKCLRQFANADQNPTQLVALSS